MGGFVSSLRIDAPLYILSCRCFRLVDPQSGRHCQRSNNLATIRDAATRAFPPSTGAAGCLARGTHLHLRRQRGNGETELFACTSHQRWYSTALHQSAGIHNRGSENARLNKVALICRGPRIASRSPSIPAATATLAPRPPSLSQEHLAADHDKGAVRSGTPSEPVLLHTLDLVLVYFARGKRLLLP